MLLAFGWCASVSAQTGTLPPNYTIVVDNADVLVQQVHYAPHETVPMHDHPAVTTVYVYLDDDQGFDILHEGAEKPAHRPPAHAGAFRVSPGNLERHSIVNNSDVSSDFVRVELKRIPVHTLHEEFRGKAEAEPLTPGVKTEYSIPELRIDRIICGDGNSTCTIPADTRPSVVVQIAPMLNTKQPRVAQWLPANTPLVSEQSWRHAQWIRVILETH